MSTLSDQREAREKEAAKKPAPKTTKKTPKETK